ncbi:hypothetical protein TBR22_A05700 [Luteitalea sp. TBR-22]|nr:hypothetical protein TBR22_A05700 [Luteitalea sp. TBR-22]
MVADAHSRRDTKAKVARIIYFSYRADGGHEYVEPETTIVPMRSWSVNDADDRHRRAHAFRER